MTPLEIKIELLKKGVTHDQIAKSLDPPVTRPAVTRVIAKKWVSARIMQAIADAINRDVKYVFSEYYFKSQDKKKTA